MQEEHYNYEKMQIEVFNTQDRMDCNQEEDKNYFAIIPVELVMIIFSSLDSYSLKAVEATCYDFKNITSQKFFDPIKVVEIKNLYSDTLNSLLNQGFFSLPHLRANLPKTHPKMTREACVIKQVNTVFQHVNLDFFTTVNVKSSKNPFSDESLRVFLLHLVKMPNLKKLNLEGIPLDKTSMEIVNIMAQFNLKELHISKSLTSEEDRELLKKTTQNVKNQSIFVHIKLPTEIAYPEPDWDTIKARMSQLFYERRTKPILASPALNPIKPVKKN
jgi:hypothetical protein